MEMHPVEDGTPLQSVDGLLVRLHAETFHDEHYLPQSFVPTMGSDASVVAFVHCSLDWFPLMCMASSLVEP